MQNIWKLVSRRFASAVPLLAFLVFMQGVSHAQTLVFSPGSISLAAGNPGSSYGPSVIPSPSTYIGPADGLVPTKGGFYGSASDKFGNIYVTEKSGYIVRVIASGNGPIPVLPAVTPQAGYVYTVAGTGVDSSSDPNPVNCTGLDEWGDGCLATQAAIDGGAGPSVAVDANGNVYITDYNASLVRVVYANVTNSAQTNLARAITAQNSAVTQPQAGYIYAIAGVDDDPNYSGNNGPTNATQIGYPFYVAVDPNGNIYIGAYDPNGGGYVLLAVSVNNSLPGFSTPNNGYLYTIVGDMASVVNGAPASSSGFAQIIGLGVDQAGDVYIADHTSVRMIYVGANGGTLSGLSNLRSGYIYTVAGGGSKAVPQFPAAISGVTATLPLSPSAPGFDPAGNLYFSSTNTAATTSVYKLDTTGNLMKVYGTGNGFGGSPDQTCTTAVDSEDDGCTGGNVGAVHGLAIDPQNNLWVADGNFPLLHQQTVAPSSYYFTPNWTQPVVIYNTAAPDPAGNHATDLEITGVSSSSSAFTVESVSTPLPNGITADCGAKPTLAPGQSCETEILYTAGSSTATGTLTVSSNSANSGGTNVIQLTGESTGNAALKATTLTVSGSLPTNSISAGMLQQFGYNLGCILCQSGGFPTGPIALHSGNTNGDTVLATVAAPGTGGNEVITFSNITLPTGSNFVYAVYGGDTNTSSSQSIQTLVTVNGTNTTTSLSVPPTPVATNASFTLSATVTAASGTPTGTVTFKSGATVLGTPQTLVNGTASISNASFATAGSYPITAIYGGDNAYNASTSTPATVTVSAPVDTTTTVGASALGIGQGDVVTLTAKVAPVSGTTAPTGSVTFYSNGSALSSAAPLVADTGDNGATATLMTSSLQNGSDVITATYGGASLFNQSNSNNNVTITVGLPGTTTALAVTPSNINYGDSISLKATVAAKVSANGTPTGSVTFAVGSTTLGTATLDGTGVATYATTSLPGGSAQITETVTATYAGTSTTFASSNGSASVTVNPLATTINTPTSSTLNPVSGQTLTLTATVVAQGSSQVPTGTVTFFSGATQLCAVLLSNSSASCPTSLLPQGQDSVTAVYAGGNGFTGSTSSALSLSVAAPPSATTTTLTASTTAQYVGQPVTFTATVATTGTGTPNGIVTFQSGTTTLGTNALGTNGQATLTTTTLAAGTYNVIAVYQGNSSYTGSTSSTAVKVVISQALTASTTTLTSSSTAVQQGQNVTFTATVTPNSPITATGNVSFMSGGTTLGTGMLYGGVATFSTTALNPANYSVTATYPGDANFTGSTSNALALAVATPTPSFTLSATPNNLTLTSGQSGAAIITLVPTYGYTGTITLSCGTGLPANVTCSFAPATLTADGKNDAVQSTLTITTNGMTAQMRDARPTWRGHNSAVLSAALFFLPVGLLGLGLTDKRKRLKGYLSLAVLAFLGTGLLALSGCAGGNGGSTTDAATGTSKIVVTAAGSTGSQSQTVNLNITIQ